MDKESTTFGLSPEKLARLLKIGSDESQSETNAGQREQKKARLLQDWLAATLPVDAVFVESLPRVLRRLYQELKPLGSRPFGTLLQDPEADMSVIKKIKDCSKKLVESAKSEAEHDAATAVYYAAIASALVFHDQRITSFSYVNLMNSFASLKEQSWLTAELVKLYGEAYDSCQEKIQKAGEEDTI